MESGLTSLGNNPFLARKAQGQFVVVTMTVQNTSDEPKSVSPDSRNSSIRRAASSPPTPAPGSTSTPMSRSGTRSTPATR
ncbi:DUF4352 domain-containing protein [Rhodococcus sp. NPDC003318]|uniref:DUF4352 domain-containing protein n=1 Tax=Rhodococcus sp. NPDC003318 TaxID=3364503 RepID=UPI00367E3F35